MYDSLLEYSATTKNPENDNSGIANVYRTEEERVETNSFAVPPLEGGRAAATPWDSPA